MESINKRSTSAISSASLMDSSNAVAALTALAHETRLAIFRQLVQQGPTGLPVGSLLETLGIPAPSLSFHLKELSIANLVRVRRDGRFLYYSAAYDTMNGLIAYLNENCCAASGCDVDCCTPTPKSKSAQATKSTSVTKKPTVKSRTQHPPATRKRPTLITSVKAKR